MPNVTMTITGVEQVERALNKIKDTVEHPDPRKAVEKVSDVWARSFAGQGSYVGGWAALAEHTIEQRRAQGFPPGPIMLRSGSLRDMATRFFNPAREGRGSSTSNYGSQTVTTVATLTLSKDGTATMGLSGKKVANQKGHGAVPARPFWFTDATTSRAAREGAIEWFKGELESWKP